MNIDEFLDVFIRAVERFLEKIPDIVSDMIQIINNIIKQQNRVKWRRYKQPKPKLLLLDKRSKIHRCRNAC